MEQLSLLSRCKCRRCKNWAYWNKPQHGYCDEHFPKHWLKKNNPEEYQKLQRAKRANNAKIPHNRVARNLRSRIKDLIKAKRGPNDFSHRIGLTSRELKVYLEKKFHSGMTWTNYGTLWHVDHIKPIKSFNLFDKQDLLKVNHYTNLQPLLAVDNIKKGARYATTV